MNKFLAISILALAATGCASKGDLKALSDRVSAVEAAHANLVSDHASIKADHEAIKAEHADLSAKIDRAFLKKNLK